MLLVYMSITMCMPGSRGQERVSGPLRFELQIIVSRYVSAGNLNLGPLEEYAVFLTTEISL